MESNRNTAPERHPRSGPLRFYAFVDELGTLFVKPYRSYEEHSRSVRGKRSGTVAGPFVASGHIEARAEARRLLGHLERNVSVADIFGATGKEREGGSDGVER